MNRKGQALVEFVLILPIFLLILFSVVDFGMILVKKNELENVSVDIVSMVRNNKDSLEIERLYPDVSIDIVNDSDYILIKIYDAVDIITPGLNRVLGDPYIVSIERIIPNA